MSAITFCRVAFFPLMIAVVFAIASYAVGQERVEVRTPGRVIVLSSKELLSKKISTGLLVLKFRGELNDELLSELDRRGIEVVDLIEKHTYWARARGYADVSDIKA
ncbi:MAG TPA: hypothetical protein VMX35_15395, partial [Acidobacteriota bacterium]|nr:hypothetical protein [Acidobacteriota bacterium]